jgi:hypothetical protein
MTQIFGEFIDDLSSGQEGLTLVFSPTSVPLKHRWRNNGLSADFMADYFATFFPGTDESSSEPDTQAEVKSAVSFIANELIENAMKFNDENSSHPISIKLQMNQQKLVFLVTNSLTQQAVEKFLLFIHELSNSDPSEMYIRHLEKDLEDEADSDNDHNLSGLGLLTMINDYFATIGWKFETVQKNPEVITVTTMVQLTV